RSRDLPRARRRDARGTRAARRRGLARRGRGDACRRQHGRDLLAFRLCFAARWHSCRRDLAPKAVRAARHAARGRASPARRQRRVSAWRLRPSPPPAGPEGAPPRTPAARAPSWGPGGAWYEGGPDPVFAQAAERPSRFIRVMILPRALIGKSSLQFVDAADAAKPRVQQYKIFADV